jgi:hypothetical protein
VHSRTRGLAEGRFARRCALSLCLGCPTCARADAAPGEPQRFEDADGVWRDFDATLRLHILTPRGPPRPGLAAAENAGWLAFGLVYYWGYPELNKADWDRPSLGDRFSLSIFRFDNNSSITNHVIHPFAGAAYYGFARVNNLGPGLAAAYGLGSAFLWEFALEWRELVSVNDLVFTFLGGLAPGEFFFQAGEYATSAPPSGAISTVGAWTLGLPRTVHARTSGDRAPPPAALDAVGLGTARWHKGLLAARLGGASTDPRAPPLVGLLAEARIVALPGFDRAGTFTARFQHGAFTEGRLSIDSSARGDLALDARFEAVMLGRYTQALTRADSERDPRGTAWLVGLATAIRYLDHRIGADDDQIAVTHVLGPALSLWGRRGPLWARLEARAFGDFAAIRSLGFESWRDGRAAEGRPWDDVKSVLVKQSYQFLLGGSGRLSLAAGYDTVALDVVGGAGRYAPLEGLDRKEEDVARVEPAGETLLELEAGLSARLARRADQPGPEVRFSLTALRHDSRYADTRIARDDVQARLNVGVGF